MASWERNPRAREASQRRDQRHDQTKQHMVASPMTLFAALLSPGEVAAQPVSTSSHVSFFGQLPILHHLKLFCTNGSFTNPLIQESQDDLNHYVLFFCHLYLEKLLKALVVQTTGSHAPRTHNLLVTDPACTFCRSAPRLTASST